MEDISDWKYIRIGTWTEILILGIQRIIPHDIIFSEKIQYEKKLENGNIDFLVKRCFMLRREIKFENEILSLES